MTLTFDALYAGDILDFSHPEMFGERGYDMGSCDDYMQQPTPHVRMGSVHIRMDERELSDVYDAEMQGNNGGSRVWATVRTVAVGGLAGLIFVAVCGLRVAKKTPCQTQPSRMQRSQCVVTSSFIG